MRKRGVMQSLRRRGIISEDAGEDVLSTAHCSSVSPTTNARPSYMIPRPPSEEEMHSKRPASVKRPSARYTTDLSAKPLPPAPLSPKPLSVRSKRNTYTTMPRSNALNAACARHLSILEDKWETSETEDEEVRGRSRTPARPRTPAIPARHPSHTLKPKQSQQQVARPKPIERHDTLSFRCAKQIQYIQDHWDDASSEYSDDDRDEEDQEAPKASRPALHPSMRSQETIEIAFTNAWEPDRSSGEYDADASGSTPTTPTSDESYHSDRTNRFQRDSTSSAQAYQMLINNTSLQVDLSSLRARSRSTDSDDSEGFADIDELLESVCTSCLRQCSVIIEANSM